MMSLRPDCVTSKSHAMRWINNRTPSKVAVIRRENKNMLKYMENMLFNLCHLMPKKGN